MSSTAARRLIAVDPSNHRHLQSLYASGFTTQRWQEALVVVLRARAVAPWDPDDLNNLAEILSRLGRRREADVAYRAAVALDPPFAMAWVNLGVNLHTLSLAGHASIAYGRALALDPGNFETAALQFSAQVAVAGGAVDLRGVERLVASARTAKALITLGTALNLANRHVLALGAYRRALALTPDAPEAWFNGSAPLIPMGMHAVAVAYCRRALALQPGYALAHSSLIFNLDFAPGLTFVEHQAERRAWALAQQRGAVAKHAHENTRDPDRRLRIGYVSSDFYDHSAAGIFGSVLRRHDRDHFDLFLYSGGVVEDTTTRELQELATSWRSTIGLSPERVAELVRRDSIDILVDLSGHTAGNHLLAFLHKPAPVQVTAWGHGTGTGLREIDYFFADPVLVPSEVRPLFAEEVYDLPCFITCEMPRDLPTVAAPPSVTSGFVTFGCMNRATKITAETIDAWSRILVLAPDARLLLKDRAFDDPAAQSRMTDAFGMRGVAPSRLLFYGRTSRKEHLEAHSLVDIALDPFPANGGVSTCEAVVMGVPVVALAGMSAPSRSSASLLTASGLPGWVASDVEDYVNIAVSWSAQTSNLADLRRRLRALYLASPVGDHVFYTRAAEAAFRDIWRRWCLKH